MPTRRQRLTRREIDLRLGYTGLGVGALTFVLVLVASFLVIEVAPRIDLPGSITARAQSVVRYPALEPVARVDRGKRATSPTKRVAPERASSDTADTADTGDAPPVPDADTGGSGTVDGGWDHGDDGGSRPDRPSTPPADGPVSQLVDPVVGGVNGAVDGATGGATQPVTGPVGELVDNVTDLGDSLLPRP